MAWDKLSSVPGTKCVCILRYLFSRFEGCILIEGKIRKTSFITSLEMPQNLLGFQHQNSLFRVHVYLHDFQIQSEEKTWKVNDLLKNLLPRTMAVSVTQKSSTFVQELLGTWIQLKCTWRVWKAFVQDQNKNVLFLDLILMQPKIMEVLW